MSFLDETSNSCHGIDLAEGSCPWKSVFQQLEMSQSISSSDKMSLSDVKHSLKNFSVESNKIKEAYLLRMQRRSERRNNPSKGGKISFTLHTCWRHH